MVSKLALAATFGMAAAAPAAVPAPVPMPVPQQNQPLIVGGVEANSGDFPYIVSLQENNSHFCGGSLISSTVVVTAAHCSVGFKPSEVKVRAGTTTWSSGGKLVGVSSITVHPSYNQATIDNDIAIWKLSQPVAAGNGIGFVSLPSQGSDPADGEMTTTAGWGYLREGSGSVSRRLMKVDVPIVDRDTCAAQYKDVGPVTSSMVCAGYPEGEKDACSGDSGGPLVDESGKLVGIVSWGSGCARANYPGVYTRVGSFIEWIAQNI